MKTVKFFAIIFIALIFLSGCVGAAGQISPEPYEVRVMLRPCEGVTVEGDNIVDVKAGRTVTFKVYIDEGYTYLSNSAGADYDPETGKLRLSDIYAPVTVDIVAAKTSDVITANAVSNNPGGVLSSREILLAGPGEVGFTAICPEYLNFLGWSEGGFLEDGGRLISENMSEVFYLSKSQTFYANFQGFSEYKILYNLNGGTTTDGSGEYESTGSYSEIYAMQQTLESNGTFSRPGYVAIGYSAEAEPQDYRDYASANEIPGFCNMGGVTRVIGESASLGVVWAKAASEDDFIYEIKDIPVITDVFPGNLTQKTENVSGAEIIAYVGTDNTAVIPEELGGKPVLSISAGAFSDEYTEKAVIPRTVVNIDKEAFSGCENLREVVFFDSVATVYDESFPKSVETVVLNSRRLPVYSGVVEGSFCIKYERLRAAEGKKIVVVSGSSSLNGLDSELFEELMPGFTVINYGTNAANPSLFFLEAISKYTSEGDVVIHAPEYSSSASMGSNEFHAKVFRGNEQCYDIFRDVNISHYDGFWDCWRKFQIGDRSDGSLVPALHQQGKPYQQPADINKYGDIAVSRPSVRGSFGPSAETFNDFKLNSENLNAVNELYKETGAELLMSFGTFDRARLSPSANSQAEFDKFTQKCADALDYPVISNIGTYIMDHERFYDSEWHPNEEGAKIRTRNLAEDLKKYLSAPGNDSF